MAEAEEAQASLDAILSALAEPTRRRVVELLRAGPRPAGELARACNMSPPAMSRHLRVLRQRGLVEPEWLATDARVRAYRLRRRPFGELRAWLEEMDTFWSEQMQAFGDFAEEALREERPD